MRRNLSGAERARGGTMKKWLGVVLAMAIGATIFAAG